MKKSASIFLCLIMILGIGKLTYNTIQYYRIVPILKAGIPQKVTLMIYPRVSSLSGRAVTFRSPDPIVTEFWSALADIRRYWPNHDTISSRDHAWFVEIFAEDGLIHIQMDFHIPSHKSSIVAGRIGTFSSISMTNYGEFQSRQLYQWYQTYSHRWLTPEGSPSAPPP